MKQKIMLPKSKVPHHKKNSPPKQGNLGKSLRKYRKQLTKGR